MHAPGGSPGATNRERGRSAAANEVGVHTEGVLCSSGKRCTGGEGTDGKRERKGSKGIGEQIEQGIKGISGKEPSYIEESWWGGVGWGVDCDVLCSAQSAGTGCRMATPTLWVHGACRGGGRWCSRWSVGQPVSCVGWEGAWPRGSSACVDAVLRCAEWVVRQSSRKMKCCAVLRYAVRYKWGAGGAREGEGSRWGGGAGLAQADLFPQALNVQKVERPALLAVPVQLLKVALWGG